MPEPACCPNSYVRPIDGGLEIEDGSERCCGPEGHVLLNVEEWHDAMHRWEQELLNTHIQRFKILQAYDLEGTPCADSVLRKTF
jgi:hypothetical protein